MHQPLYLLFIYNEMKYSTTWRETDIEIQVRALEEGETLPETAAVITNSAKALLRLSSKSRLRLVNLYKRPSKLEFAIEGYAIKVVESAQKSSAISNSVLYVSGVDFDLLRNATNSLQFSGNAIEGFRLEALSDKPNMYGFYGLSEEEQLQLFKLFNDRERHKQQREYYQEQEDLCKEQEDLCTAKIDAILRVHAKANNLEEVSMPELPAAVKKCFNAPDTRLYERVRKVIDKYRDSPTALARLEIALEDLDELRGTRKHKVLVEALKSWGLIKDAGNDAEKSRCDQMSCAYSRIQENKEKDIAIEDIKRIINPLSGLPY